MVPRSQNIPTILVAFGVTGDLMRLKVIPALFELYLKRELPTMFRVIGFSRKEWNDGQFRDYVRTIVTGHTPGAPEDELAAFLDLFQFERGDFGKRENYDTLKRTMESLDAAWGVCSNKLFYLAVAPEFYEGISQDLSASELINACDPTEGWTRVVVEKPFGESGDAATRLDLLLGKLFKEEQIYRIDHYLAKDMLQNILNFRFANNLFETMWGNKLIESIHIRLFEKVGVERRGAFYDRVGVLRDVGQNHLLQVLALLTMDRPEALSSEAIRDKRAAILETLEVMASEAVPGATFRAQYEGYRDIEGVAPDSITETYFKVRASLVTPRWEGVPITLESGKRLGKSLKEIVVRLRHPEPCLCPPGAEHNRNEIIIRMEPKEEILIGFLAKKPGFTFETEPREFSFELHEEGREASRTAEYERLLIDCLRGDQTLFVSTREVTAMWRYIDPILHAWQKGTENVPLHFYAPDTGEVLEQASIV
ncbi:MAG: glucose-6-phosphate dehydrogenase [Minisyncoccota bacterium]